VEVRRTVIAHRDLWGPAVAGRRFVIVGGAGFMGSHFTDTLLAQPDVAGVTLYDNFTSGRCWHYQQHQGDDRLAVVEADAKDGEALRAALDGHDVVIHLASNPDIARAVTEPDIDFYEGTYLTNQVVEAMRVTSPKRLLYASGSGVYGDLGEMAASARAAASGPGGAPAATSTGAARSPAAEGPRRPPLGRAARG